MLNLILTQMKEIFSLKNLTNGKLYQQNGHVLKIKLNDGLLIANVRDKANCIYNTYLDFTATSEFIARCNCQFKYCEHIAASLFAIAALQKQKNFYLPYSINANIVNDASTHKLNQQNFNKNNVGLKEIITIQQINWFSELKNNNNSFYYKLGVIIDNKPISIIPLLAKNIHKFNNSKFESIPDKVLVSINLPNGKVLKVPFERIKPLIRFMLQYISCKLGNKNYMQVMEYQLVQVQEIEQTIAVPLTHHNFNDIPISHYIPLCKFDQLPTVNVPHGLRISLRDYQKIGLNWLQYLRVKNCGGVLADDMGLGKTLQILANLLLEKEQGRLLKTSLIITPTSVIWNWFKEAKTFTPQLNIAIFHGSNRFINIGNFAKYDVIISTYNLIKSDESIFNNYNFYYLILDESQFIKNIHTKTKKIIQKIQAQHRLCLTGTPVENNLSELWSHFNFLMPHLLGNIQHFKKFFSNEIEKKLNQDKNSLLARRIQPFILRRTKKQVLNELPQKTEIIRMVELTTGQRDMYDAIYIAMEQKIKQACLQQNVAIRRIIFLDALLKLRQVCCDPRLLNIPEAKITRGISAKLKVTMELLADLVAVGRRILIFSQFTSMLKLIEIELIDRSYPYLKLTGQTKNRQVLVDKFQQENIPIFLISLKAGGFGLNLTAADTVIHYDPWWNPAIEDQATDRIYRIGQHKPIFVYKLITSNTVEGAILQLHATKRKLLESIYYDKFKPAIQEMEELAANIFGIDPCAWSKDKSGNTADDS